MAKKNAALAAALFDYYTTLFPGGLQQPDCLTTNFNHTFTNFGTITYYDFSKNTEHGLS